MGQNLCLEIEQNRLSLNLTKSSAMLWSEWPVGADCGTERLQMVIKIPGVWGHPLEHGEPTREHTHNKELFSLPTASQ